MKIATKWVNLYLKNPLSTAEIVEALERTEVEIEEVISAPVLDKKIITAKVVKVSAHPNADRLKLVEVEFGKQKAKLVCGAPNVRTGLIVAYAKPGTILIDDTKINEAEIRGEKSAGMLCSSAELGLSNDHSGVIELDPDLPLGISLCDIENLGDILDIKTPANRWDMLSVFGLAREISANSSGNSIVEPEKAKIAYSNREVVKVKETGECKRFVTAVVNIDNLGDTPAWLVENLESAGIRSISPVVDITNFVMLETGQPSHAYDVSKLKGALQVRFAKQNEALSTLDGTARVLDRKDLVIADSSGAIGLAGIMGGAKTEIDRSTKQIVLEVANFDKTTTRRTALRNGIRTEASTRFEKGLPLPLCNFAFERLMQLLQNICQGEIVGEACDQLYAWPWIRHVGLRQRRAEAVLGVKLDEKQIQEGLRARCFEAEHFSLSKEAKKHLGKPYVWGASFKLNNEDCFDCSYLVERIYSKIGVMIGHTAQEQFNSGKAVELSDLKAGDLLFYSGHWDKVSAKTRGDIGHVGMYLGKDEILEASQFEYNKETAKYEKRSKSDVRIVKTEVFSENPSFKGARRYINSFNHIIAITAPWWRTDIMGEADLIEECAKIFGYDNLPSELPKLPPTNTDNHQLLPSLMSLREDLVARGLFEVTTYSFVSQKDLERTNTLTNSVLAIENPMSREQEFLRNSLLSSHMQTAARNENYFETGYEFFEIARIYEQDTKSKTKAQEYWHLGVTAIGENSLIRLKSVLDSIDLKYKLNFVYTREAEKLQIEGRSAKFKSLTHPNVEGSYSQLTPAFLRSYSLSREISFAEIRLSSDFYATRLEKSVLPLPYQMIYRDITAEVKTETLWQEIVAIVRSDQIKRIEFTGEFSDDLLSKKGNKKVSFRLGVDCGAHPDQKQIATLIDQIEKKLSRL